MVHYCNKKFYKIFNIKVFRLVKFFDKTVRSQFRVCLKKIGVSLDNFVRPLEIGKVVQL
jgi:hypothetical protein